MRQWLSNKQEGARSESACAWLNDHGYPLCPVPLCVAKMVAHRFSKGLARRSKARLEQFIVDYLVNGILIPNTELMDALTSWHSKTINRSTLGGV